MKIHEERLGDIVKIYPQLLTFLARFNIQLGFGEKTISEICFEHKISLNFFIELMLLIIKKYDFHPNYIEKFEPKLTINYLIKSHKSFLNEYIIDIENIIQELKKEELTREEDCKLLQKFFEQYKIEVIEHLDNEDKLIFPYILKLEEIIEFNTIDTAIIDIIQKNPIKKYIKKHHSLDEKLNDLKNLIIMFFKPFNSTRKIRLLIKLLYELEEELKLHELIENKVLFPLTQRMEDKILHVLIQTQHDK